MNHASHFLIGVIVYLASLHHGNSAENPISTRTLLSNLASNVGTILTPTFVKEFETNSQNRNAVSDTITPVSSTLVTSTSSPITATISKTKSTKHQRSPMTTRKPKTTTVPTTILFPEEKNESNRKSKADDEDSGLEPVRAQQRQLENQFPFDFRNNFDAAFQNTGRQLNSASSLGFGRDLFNPEGFQPFGGSLDGGQGLGVQGGLDGERGTGGVRTSGIGSRFPIRPTEDGQNTQFTGLNRPFGDSNFDRFQDFGRFGFDGRIPDNRFLDPSFGSPALTDRFNNFGGQPDLRNNLPQNRQNFPQDLPRNTNLLNPTINPQINALNQVGSDVAFNGRSPFLNPNFQEHYSQNNFGSSAQPFRDLLPNDPRNPQRTLVYPVPPRDEQSPRPVGSTNSKNSNNDILRSNDASTQTLISSRRSESDPAIKPASNIPEIVADVPGVQSLQDRLDIDSLFYPALDDYSDVRVNPDVFKQHLLASNIIEKHSKNNVS